MENIGNIRKVLIMSRNVALGERHGKASLSVHSDPIGLAL